MRKNVREMFSNKAIVKPLYKVRSNKRKLCPRKDLVSINIGSTVKLCGDDINVKREIYDSSGVVNSIQFRVPKSNLEEDIPGACEKARTENDSGKCAQRFEYKIHEVVNDENVNKTREGKIIRHRIMEDDNGSKFPRVDDDVNDDNVDSEEDVNSNNEKDRSDIIQKVPDSWLRVFPCPKAKGESIPSVILRCAACQLGLTTILVLWNLIWVFTIHHFEGPYEVQVSSDFQKEQNQLVINLATELRQITPVSPKWRAAIEARIDEERRMTVAAVGRGVRLLPGHFWDLPGTFLFSIYVLTALGFGAPVPQTNNGRTSALIYAAIAVPTHIYLMMNVSTGVICHIDHCIRHMKQYVRNKGCLSETIQSRDSSNCSRKGVLKAGIKRKIGCILNMLSIRALMPLACMLYYTLGALGFGWLRGKAPLEIILFPLEFTTSGGLEDVECRIRILYGFYVEGTMCLLALVLAVVRRQSSAAATSIAKRYRLFATENCSKCNINSD